MTQRLSSDPVDLKAAAQLIKAGKLVAFPTETVYGLCASVFNPVAIADIFTAKGRPQDNPLITHISSIDQITWLAEDPPEAFYQLADVFFPGPLTILLKKRQAVPGIVTANLPTLAVRMPAHNVGRELIRLVGEPLVAPSANLSGRPSSTTADHVLHDLEGKIEAVVDGGPCVLGIESTVLLLEPEPKVLRPGAISAERIEEVLKRRVEVCDHCSHAPLSPGLKYRHYAPSAKMQLFFSQESLENYICEAPERQRTLLTSITPHNLYAELREADLKSYEEILVLCSEKMQDDRALMNRLKRAANCH